MVKLLVPFLIFSLSFAPLGFVQDKAKGEVKVPESKKSSSLESLNVKPQEVEKGWGDYSSRPEIWSVGLDLLEQIYILNVTLTPSPPPYRPSGGISCVQQVGGRNVATINQN
ncbi:MAG: hypothetical protein ABIH63_04255 [archaeon]